jgi:hypothetical protein
MDPKTEQQPQEQMSHVNPNPEGMDADRDMQEGKDPDGDN